jgi:hypothetical protein
MSLSIARVLSVSLSCSDSLARAGAERVGGAEGRAAAGAYTRGGAEDGCAACVPAGLATVLAPSRGSEMAIFAPHRLHRTTRRLPRTLSSAI